ncbi:hypothetical protein OK015_14465 [Mycobacterium sp. Aquia_216]|uniref:hypothetical protein n=1 Tax=Mycobacterium sp. Aquia_216 TaxID=2991729 RepID=UPI00227C0AC5|nr:hypothetical protein [Mycobacterium sp. Aquia_216]WAJ42499.1 hypothetical protein OK015_14465 [Mycobacterium sp. Aquia_216]
MAVLAVICAFAMATCVGFYVGRRAGSTPSTWGKRTSRIALGRLAMSFVVLMVVRRIRRSTQAQRLFRDARLRSVAPLDFLRGGVAVIVKRATLV